MGKGKRHSITSKVHQRQPTLLQYLKQPHYLRLFLSIHHINRPFAASHSRGTKPPCWRAKVALGQDKQKAYMSLNDNFLCLTCPARLLLFSKERQWLSKKGLLILIGRTKYLLYKWHYLVELVELI